MLRHYVKQTAALRWTPRLMQTLLEELSIDETFGVLMGDPTNLPKRVYPQAVAVAVL